MESDQTRYQELSDALTDYEDVGMDVLREAGNLMAADKSDAFESDIAWDEMAVTRDALVMTARDFGLSGDEMKQYVARAQGARLVRDAAADLDTLSKQFTEWITKIYTTLEDATQPYTENVSSHAGPLLFKTEKWRKNLYVAAEWEGQQLFTIHARVKDSLLDRFRAWWRRVTGKESGEPQLNITAIGPRGAALTVRQFHEQYRRSADDDASPRDKAFRSAREELYAAVDRDVVRGLAAGVGLQK